MVDREPLEPDPNAARKPERAVLLNLGARSDPRSQSCLSRWNSAWSAFTGRHMGNPG